MTASELFDIAVLWLGNLSILLGAFFVFTGAFGLLRMPDFFTRLHPAGVVDSMGIPFVLVGLVIHNGFTLIGGQLLLLMLFLLLTCPTACHALAKAAFLSSSIAKEEAHALRHAEKGEHVENRKAQKKLDASLTGDDSA